VRASVDADPHVAPICRATRHPMLGHDAARVTQSP
jgi:hypothetical protein